MVRIDKQRLLNRDDGEEEIKRVRGEIERILGGSNEIGIALSDERVAGRPYRDEFETFVAESVAFAIGAAKAAPQDVAIVIAGADTSHSCCRVLGINELLPKHEVLTGIPLSMTPAGFRLVSKAGGFGHDDALVRSVRFFRKGRVLVGQTDQHDSSRIPDLRSTCADNALANS